jgi:hypothetical protein
VVSAARASAGELGAEWVKLFGDVGAFANGLDFSGSRQGEIEIGG